MSHQPQRCLNVVNNIQCQNLTNPLAFLCDDCYINQYSSHNHTEDSPNNIPNTDSTDENNKESNNIPNTDSTDENNKESNDIEVVIYNAKLGLFKELSTNYILKVYSDEETLCFVGYLDDDNKIQPLTENQKTDIIERGMSISVLPEFEYSTLNKAKCTYKFKRGPNKGIYCQRDIDDDEKYCLICRKRPQSDFIEDKETDLTRVLSDIRTRLCGK